MGSKDHNRKKGKKRSSDREGHRERKRAIASLGYSNDTNPFQDPNLSKPFTWKKKSESAGASRGKAKGGDDWKDELIKVRQYRTSREEDRREFERMKDEAARARDQIDLTVEAKHEATFELVQRLLRSRVRLVESRPTPFDLLIKNGFIYSASDYSLSAIGSAAGAVAQEYESHLQDRLNPTVTDPLVLLSSLTREKLETLDQEVYDLREELAKNNNTVLEYWEWIAVLLKQRLGRASSNRNADITPEVLEEINSLFSDKSREELLEMQGEIQATLDSSSTSSSAGVDVEYWENVAEALRVALATASLAECVADWKEMENTMERKAETVEMIAHKNPDLIGSTSSSSGGHVSDTSKTAIAMQRHEEQKGMDDEEEEFINEVSVKGGLDITSAASNSFVPRKPRYYNRVKSGYDWHKYNQTHYDQDNPPPKVVQGYKFNLFYPDLIDKTVTPSFVIEKAGTPDFCILRFRAGPPYQDIAFQIVNQQWDYGQKNGFKSVFERGILHLYFNFKRHRYRR